jgi:hypothetical protein
VIYRLPLATLALLISVAASAGGWAQDVPAWERLSAYERKLHDLLLPSSAAEMTDADARQFVSRQGTRSSTYLAVGLFCRNRGSDAMNAAKLLRQVLKLQYDDPANRRHGVWPKRQGDTSLDENWREFVGVGLIVAKEQFANSMPHSLRNEISDALLRAAEGAARRNVGASYTNISLMSAFLLAHAGTQHDRPELTRLGQDKARSIFAAFGRTKTFSEYNSPTYYGVDLMALALWRKHGPDDTFRSLGKQMEVELWRDIAAFYHADLKNLAGPYFRSYEMDMTRYATPTGVLIALALNGAAHAPVPDVGTGRKSFEWDYTPMFAVLGHAAPDDALRSLAKFTEPRQLRRTVYAGDRELQIQAIIEPRWMMGAATGLQRRWEQQCPATIHWRTDAQGEIGWLLVLGQNGADCTIDQATLQIRLPLRDRSAHRLRIQLGVPGVTPDMFSSDEWKLPGMTLHTKTRLNSPEAGWIKDPYHGRVIEISWAVSPEVSADTNVLEIRPVPRVQ